MYVGCTYQVCAAAVHHGLSIFMFNNNDVLQYNPAWLM